MTHFFLIGTFRAIIKNRKTKVLNTVMQVFCIIEAAGLPDKYLYYYLRPFFFIIYIQTLHLDKFIHSENIIMAFSLLHFIFHLM